MNSDHFCYFSPKIHWQEGAELTVLIFIHVHWFWKLSTLCWRSLLSLVNLHVCGCVANAASARRPLTHSVITQPRLCFTSWPQNLCDSATQSSPWRQHFFKSTDAGNMQPFWSISCNSVRIMEQKRSRAFSFLEMFVNQGKFSAMLLYDWCLKIGLIKKVCVSLISSVAELLESRFSHLQLQQLWDWKWN